MMNLYEPTDPLTFKTRPSFLTRTKGRTRKTSLDNQSISNLRIETNQCRGAQRSSLSSSKDVAHRDDLNLPTQIAPVTSSKLKTTFSEIGHAVEEIRCLSRSLVSRRTKTVVPTGTEVDEAMVDDAHVVAQDTENYRISRQERRPAFPVAPRWLSRWAGVPTRQPRRAPAAQMRLRAPTETYPEVVCAPDAGLVAAPLNIPDSSSSGAAARAAAAAQNEILGSFRRLYADECMVHRDSESGIGIEVRVRSEEDQVPVLRQGRPCLLRLLS